LHLVLLLLLRHLLHQKGLEDLEVPVMDLVDRQHLADLLGQADRLGLVCLADQRGLESL
jgi:hypothetical protein